MFDSGSYAMREGNFKVIKPKNGKDASDQEPLELYDLGKDVSEKTNLAGQQEQRLKAMIEHYEKWNSQLKEPSFEGLEKQKPKSEKP